MTEKLKIDLDGEVAILTLSDPARLNAADLEMVAALTGALQDIATGRTKARAVVLTGEGRAFCSGANLVAARAEVTLADGARDVGRPLEIGYNPLMAALADLPVPLIVAVNGPAAGIGCAFALMGDLILAAETASFAIAFRRIALVPDGGLSWLLPRLVGKARAMELALLGETIDARKALDWGLVNRVYPDDELMAGALAIARDLASGPPSLGLTRRLIWDGMDHSFASQLDRERRAQKEAGASEDFMEGIEAFQQKRPAVFKGR
jgi:2-(1,2-epoxy-1,2-dihydrophenyl)acetyl-CoA isomerase